MIQHKISNNKHKRSKRLSTSEAMVVIGIEKVKNWTEECIHNWVVKEWRVVWCLYSQKIPIPPTMRVAMENKDSPTEGVFVGHSIWRILFILLPKFLFFNDFSWDNVTPRFYQDFITVCLYNSIILCINSLTVKN